MLLLQLLHVLHHCNSVSVSIVHTATIRSRCIGKLLLRYSDLVKDFIENTVWQSAVQFIGMNKGCVYLFIYAVQKGERDIIV